MMKQLKSMQMEMFSGGADLIAADKWRRKLEKTSSQPGAHQSTVETWPPTT
uniref:Uncharacterized protein n=1 Tax=Brassica campestris TaxID=3711 RepID=A0A3P6DDP3_BRACM|nr:unnamed protein product [Brassica rapa]